MRRDRIGKGKLSTAYGTIEGVGRPSQIEDDLDIDGPIVKEYNWETGKFEPTNEKPRHNNFSGSEGLDSRGDGQYVNPKNKQ